jgi:hypothetical protein
MGYGLGGESRLITTMLASTAQGVVFGTVISLISLSRSFALTQGLPLWLANEFPINSVAV